MSDKVTLLLHTLPVEIVYQILDNLRNKALFISVRNVCQRLDTIIDSYHRYQVKLDFLTFFEKRIYSINQLLTEELSPRSTRLDLREHQKEIRSSLKKQSKLVST